MANPTASKELRAFHFSLIQGNQDKKISDLLRNFPYDAKTALNRAKIFNDAEREAVLGCLAQAVNAITYFDCISGKFRGA